jgi:hypothetical protein
VEALKSTTQPLLPGSDAISAEDYAAYAAGLCGSAAQETSFRQSCVLTEESLQGFQSGHDCLPMGWADPAARFLPPPGLPMAAAPHAGAFRAAATAPRQRTAQWSGLSRNFAGPSLMQPDDSPPSLQAFQEFDSLPGFSQEGVPEPWNLAVLSESANPFAELCASAPPATWNEVAAPLPSMWSAGIPSMSFIHI